MAKRNARTMAAALVCGLIVVSLLLSMSVAGTIAATTSPTPRASTPSPVPTPVPTPEPRMVLSAAGWDSDHAYVQVTNNGPDIDVEAYIGSLSNKMTTHVISGMTTKVPTMSVNAQPGQIIRCWFKAYQNGTLIDSMEVPITVTSGTPTPPPEAAIVTGTIVDAVTNAPINGAEIIFTSETYDKQYPSTYTDASGTFMTAGKMYLDTYLVTVKAGGYQTLTAMRTAPLTSGAQKLTDPIKLTPLAVSSPTPTPAPPPTPSATPGSPMDAWLSLLYSPQACCGTLAVALGAIVSATAIYEWTMRQRERRQREAAEGKKKDPKDSK